MTIDDIKKEFPNGFHDSDILEINLDYLNENASILFEIDLTSPDGPVPVESRKGYLRLNGVLYFSIEPPTGSWPGEYVATDDKIWIVFDTSDLSTLKFDELNPRLRLPGPLPNGAFQHCFYSSSHNSYIYLAAMDAEFQWLDHK